MPPFLNVRSQDTASANRSHLHRNKKVRKLDAELGDCAGRRIGREELHVLFVETGEVTRSGQQHQYFDDIIELDVGGAQNILAINERLD